ncbi:EAL domain-containing protein [Halocynthiibacter namhaensis]|uniref:EAL domain-containing protein n=1 Tax=Halocynthiibacter namhaensis TaxID=1290553 RepID=UPI000578E5B6|nr:EAL domain-containing protein [Halocynthiibacter namhaensis]
MLSDELKFDTGDEGTGGGPLSRVLAHRDRDILQMVHKSLVNRNVALAYQPIVRSDQLDQISFHEGLVRVLDENGRIIPAKEFINQIENNELGRLIDCRAIELGLRALADDQSLRLSINMSARSIGYAPWVKALNAGLAQNDTIGERLILEITESSAMQMPELVTSFMADLQSQGIAFALDDFGAGYTAFRFFKDFFFDVIKIDGQFITGIANNSDNQVLTRALVSIARHFDMFTVAECVESQDDIAVLQDIGIDCLQGYYFGSPTMVNPMEQREKANQSRA